MATQDGSAPVDVVLADDHALVRAGLRLMLESGGDVRVLGEAGSADALLAWLERHAPPDVVVTELSMPGLDPLAAVTQMRKAYPAVRVLVLTIHDTPDTVRLALAHGAHGYVVKDAGVHELQHALRAVADGKVYYSSSVSRCLLQQVEPAAEDDLTERQVEVLKLIAQGKTSKEVGCLLGLSSKTVDVHRARIMERLGITDVASLTRYAIRKRLLQA